MPTLGSGFVQTFFIALFAREIRGEFGLSHGEWGAVYSAANPLSAAALIKVGGLVDVMRIRSLALSTIGCFAAACLGWRRWSLRCACAGRG